MSDLQNRNAVATKKALEAQNARLLKQDTKINDLNNTVHELLHRIQELENLRRIDIALRAGNGSTS